MSAFWAWLSDFSKLLFVFFDNVNAAISLVLWASGRRLSFCFGGKESAASWAE